MNEFISKYQDALSGELCGWDRLVLMGTLWRNRLAGMKGYLWAHGLGARNFGDHAEEISKKVKRAAVAPFEAANRPVRYLNSGKLDKQGIARQIAAQDKIVEGPICALTAVELCSSYAIQSSEQGPQLRIVPRKGLFVYQYWMHPVFGFMSVRLQTWFPFPIHVYVNGREWLAQQMKQAGIGYHRHANCFPWIEDVARAQALMDEQQRAPWVDLLDGLAKQIHPLLFSEMSRNYPMEYYWTCSESEWAMDLMFRDPERLRRLTPLLLRLGMLSFSSADVLRFMGKQVNREGGPFGQPLPLSSDWKARTNGTRVKHRLGPNSIKIYDKAYEQQGAVLRAEVTITVPKYFKILRCTDDAKSKPGLRPMRQSLADLQARGQTCQNILDRYTNALAAVDDSTTLEELTGSVERRVRWKGKSVRALHPFEPADHELLQAINRGEFAIGGFRNRDLQALLYSRPARDKSEQRRRSAALTRQLRMLRAHGLIRKRPRSHRYDVSPHGRQILNAILLAHKITVQQLLPLAA